MSKTPEIISVGQWSEAVQSIEAGCLLPPVIDTPTDVGKLCYCQNGRRLFKIVTHHHADGNELLRDRYDVKPAHGIGMVIKGVPCEHVRLVPHDTKPIKWYLTRRRVPDDFPFSKREFIIEYYTTNNTWTPDPAMAKAYPEAAIEGIQWPDSYWTPVDEAVKTGEVEAVYLWYKQASRDNISYRTYKHRNGTDWGDDKKYAQHYSEAEVTEGRSRLLPGEDFERVL